MGMSFIFVHRRRVWIIGRVCDWIVRAADHWMDLLVIDSANVATSDNGSDDAFVENDGTNKIQAAVALPPAAAGGTKQQLVISVSILIIEYGK